MIFSYSTCSVIDQQLLFRYLEDELDAKQAEQIEKHVEKCPRCEEALRRMAEAPLSGLAEARVQEFVDEMRRAAEHTTDRPDELGEPGAPPRFTLPHCDGKLSGSTPGNGDLICRADHGFKEEWQPEVIMEASPRSAIGLTPGRVCKAGLSAAAAACLVFALHYFLTPAQASNEPNPWHEMGTPSRTEWAKRIPTFLALQHLCDPIPWETVPDEYVSEIGHPSYDGFEMLEDSKVFDMSAWQPVRREDIGKQRLSPVFQTRVLVLKRKPGHPDNRRLRFKYWTEGFCVDPLRPRSTDIVREAKQLEPRGMRACRVWELDIDVSDRPEGEVFTMATSAIFWNGFPDQPTQWAATAVGALSVRRAEFGVILPRTKTITAWSLWKYPSGWQIREPENKLKSGAPPRLRSGILYWPIAGIESGYTYELSWDWK